MPESLLDPITDAVVCLRPPDARDPEVLIAGRDAEFRRFLGPGSDRPQPTACVTVDSEVVGWVDYDLDREWLEPGEVNLGYNVFASHRGRGYASRAVQLLLHHLALRTNQHTATLLIDAGNSASLALAARTGFSLVARSPDQRYYKRVVPPLAYSDGGVSIRRAQLKDLDSSLEAIDEDQIRWLWVPGWREDWEAKTPEQRREHGAKNLAANLASFGRGPKWSFAIVAAADDDYVGHVDCDLGNGTVPAGEANISYSCHPAHRGRGYVSTAVRLIMRFLVEHTGAREAHIITDTGNVASRRVARAVGATERERWTDVHGRPMVRHVAGLRRRSPGPGSEAE